METTLEPRTATRNRYDLQELAGAFGDLGTLIPFVVGYITVNHMDPAGILVGFGVFKLWAGLYFKTPVPIQPMKAIGTAAISQGGAITHGAIFASGLFTGAIWGLLGFSGAVSWIQKITRRPVVQGIVLGLGLGFVVEGIKMTQGDLLLAAIAGPLTLVLLSYPRIPAMLALFALRAGVALVREPTLQPDLPRVCAHLQAMGFAVKLDTNGSRPAVLHALLADQLVDYVAMDVKAPRRSTPRSLAWPPTSRRSERAFCSCPPAASRTSSGRRWSNPC